MAETNDRSLGGDEATVLIRHAPPVVADAVLSIKRDGA
jgi:hypothetical protein